MPYTKLVSHHSSSSFCALLLVVRLAAAGLNFIDVYRREGRYPMDFPHVVGSEGAGTVVI